MIKFLNTLTLLILALQSAFTSINAVTAGVVSGNTATTTAVKSGAAVGA